MKNFKTKTTQRILLALLLNATFILAATQEYFLRPGDVISINVVDNPEFSLRTKIRPDGRINFPVLGDLEVSGTTSTEIVKMMEEKLQPYVNNAAVSVTIEQYFANKIFIIGDLNTNGEFPIFEPIDVMRAIAMAGGLTNSKAKEGRIIKANGQVIIVSFKVLFAGGKNEAYMLHPGDTFYVPKSFTVPWGAWNLIVATLSSTLALYLLITTIGNR